MKKWAAELDVCGSRARIMPWGMLPRASTPAATRSRCRVLRSRGSSVQEGLEQFLARLDDSEPEEEDRPFAGTAGAEEQAAKVERTAAATDPMGPGLANQLAPSLAPPPCLESLARTEKDVTGAARRTSSAGGRSREREPSTFAPADAKGRFDDCAVVPGIEFPRKVGDGEIVTNAESLEDKQ